MKLIVGLGNPGTQYARTRHNAGFMVVDRLADSFAKGAITKGRFGAGVVEADIDGEKCLLIKPGNFMNRSGSSVAEAVNFYKLQAPSDLLVVADDLAFPIGTVRLKPAGGPGGHNGLTDVQRALGGDNYPRLRVGIGAKPEFMDQADYVLSRFTAEEQPLFDGSIDQAAKACRIFAAKGIDAAMNACNAPPAVPKPKRERPPGDSPPQPPPT